MKSYKKILVMRLDRIGDVLLSTPVIKALRGAYPESEISFMASPYAIDIVKGNPYLNEVIVYDKMGAEKGGLGNFKFVASLRKKKYDLAIILHPTNRSHLVAFFSGIPERIGYNKKMGMLLTKKIPHTKQYGLKHEMDYALGILAYIGVKSPERALYMPITEKSEAKVKKIYAEHGLGDRDTIVVINPTSSCPSKMWPVPKFVEVAHVLAKKHNAKLVIISDAKDKETADNLSRSVNAKHLNLAGMTTVSDLASVLRRAKVFISNDSGPVHIASAVGTPVIAIFGRNDRGLSPERWGPLGKRDIILHKDAGCEVCLAHNCRIGFRCLNSVTVEEVVDEANKILSPKETI